MNWKTKKNGNRQGFDYGVYQMSKKEYLRYGLQGLALQGLIAYTFYRSVVVFVLFMPFLYFFLQEKRKELCDKRKHDLQLQFKDVVLALATGMQAGYSVEGACKEAYRDIRMLYGMKSEMGRELLFINAQLSNNRKIEELFYDLGNRSKVEDIEDFAEVFGIAKRSSGDLTKIMKNTSQMISEKLEVKREIITVISAKRLEQKIMSAIPFFIILYIDFSTPGYFAPLYGNVLGIFSMTICLCIYGAAVWLAKKTTEIPI